MKKLILLFSIIFINFNLTFADIVEKNLQDRKLQNTVQPDTFADVVERVMYATVNIYTDQNKPKKDNSNHPFLEFKELFKNNGIFKDFDFPSFLDDPYTNPKAVSLGSGFLIDKTGYIVTNYHVVQNAAKINIKLFDNTEVEAKIIGIDKKTDLALLKIDLKKDLPFVKFGDDRKLRVGDWVIAIGSPFGFNHTVTKGIVSSKARDISIDADGIVNNYLQTDAPINKGNSGGPLFNLSGEVVGVNTSIYSTSGANAGVGFAIPSQTVEKVVEQLKKFGKVKRGLLNIVVQPVTSEIAEGLGIKEVKGVLVIEVFADGAGYKAGLKAGDIILELNGKKISSPRELQVMVAETEVNSNIKILVLRNNKQKELITTIAADALEKNQESSHTKKISSITEIEINKVVFADLNKNNGQTNHDQTKGAVVVSIDKYSSWAQYIKAGDIVTNVNQQEVHRAKDVEQIYNRTKSNKNNIIFMIKRNNNSVFLVLPVPK